MSEIAQPKKRNVCFVTTNRADYSRIRAILFEIKKRDIIESQIIVVASHLLKDFGTTIDDIRSDGFKITAVANTILEGEDLIAMTKSVGVAILELPTLFNIYNPDLVFITGDRFDAFPIAISAALMNIPVVHLQGGEVTGTIDESIRHAITKLSHFHLPSTKESAERIIKMGEDPSKVFNVGCPAIDYFQEKESFQKEELIAKNKMINEKYALTIDFSKPYLILIQHPVTTEFDKVDYQIKETLDAIVDLKMQTLMIYPNVDAGSVKMMSIIRGYEDKAKYPFISMAKSIVFEEFIEIFKFCSCMVGNSSSGIRESCFFGIPAVNIGTRQNGRERGNNVLDVPPIKEEIKKAIEKALIVKKFPVQKIFGDGHASKRIVDVLEKIELGNAQKRICY